MTVARLAIVAAAGISLTACDRAPPDPRGVERGETLLTISASGRNEARPDEAEFVVGVEATGATSDAASQANADKMTAVTRAITGAGVAAEDLQTRSLTLGKVDYGRDRGKYRAHNLVAVRVRDPARLSAVLAAATGAGANVVEGPTLRLSDREAAARSAYGNAFRSARQRAQAYADAAGLKIVRVIAIRDGIAGGGGGPYPVPAAPPPPPPLAAPTSEESIAPPPFNPGLMTQEVQVQVDFALGPK